MNQRVSAMLVVGMALAALVGCSESGSGSLSKSSPTATASPSPTLDPEVRKAVEAYEAFEAAANKAQEDPVGEGQALARNADFSRFSYDPALSQMLVDVHVLDSYNAEYRGSAPTSHVQVLGADLDATPYPLVKLADCRVPRGEYVPYNRKTGKRLRLASGADLTEPYETTVEVISVKGNWGVRSLEVQREGTCQP